MSAVRPHWEFGSWGVDGSTAHARRQSMRMTDKRKRHAPPRGGGNWSARGGGHEAPPSVNQVMSLHDIS
eukprot:scaffold267413_cov31-Tisochrysis_lutea.AAC.2